MRSLSLILLTACSSPESPNITAATVEPPTESLAASPAELIVPEEERYAASHILIAYRGSTQAPPHVNRTREEARALALSVLNTLQQPGSSFETLAAEHSDGPSSQRKGYLGVYRTGTLVPAFESAVAATAVGEITPLTETPFGFHIIRREMVVEYRARHIVVGFEGARNSKSKRPKDQALAMIQAARGRIESGIAFDDVAREISEDATAKIGGDLGVIAPGQLVMPFEDALQSLATGQLSGPVETPYGYHLIQRL